MEAINPLWRWAPVGDRAILVTWQGTREDRVVAVRQLVEHARRLHPPPFDELVPGIDSVLFIHDPLRGMAQSMWEQITDILPYNLSDVPDTPTAIEIPVQYDGPDIERVADACGLTVPEVVALHTSQPFPVLMLGFMPGFPYIGNLPSRLHLPRRSTPRIEVPAGSVAIANDQTGIYPSQSPGGWHLIGRTTVRLFDPTRDPPSLLKPGDLVQFVGVEAPHG